MKRFQGFIAGMIVTLMLTGVVFAAGGIKSATYNSNKVIFDGKEISVSAMPMITVIKDGESSGSNYMPVRAVLEGMGYNVAWDANLKAVVIKSKTATSITNPPTNTLVQTAEEIKKKIINIPTITTVEIVTEKNDPNGRLGKQGGYIGALYFISSNVNIKDLYIDENEEDNAFTRGTDGGGCIEIYANSSDANKRNSELAVYDGTLFASGSHKVLATMVVRTSNKLTASQQKDLEAKIIDVLK